MTGISEFDLIDRYLRPLAANAPGAFALTDDAAVLPELPDGMAFVVTKDALAVGTHMLTDDPPGTMAQKAIRVNLSDLAAMGARPVGIFMALCLGRDTEESFVTEFIGGLTSDLETFEISLMGGDVIRQEGPFLVSVTAIGQVPRDKPLRRNGAKPGDDVWVSGTLGDAALGLTFARGISDSAIPIAKTHSEYLIDRYRIPRPQVQLGSALAGVAHSCVDISDGLCADVSHICTQSGVSARIEAGKLPASDALQDFARDDAVGATTAMLTGGDDYELAFTAPDSARERIQELSGQANTKVTRIGKIFAADSEAQGNSAPVIVVDVNGQPVEVSQPGYRHV